VKLAAVVAAAENDVIGADGDLPWHLPADLRRFRRLTLDHAVILGNRTHKSILARLGRPLPGRFSIVLTRGLVEQLPDLVSASSVTEAVKLAREYTEEHGKDVAFVAGGAQVYAALLPRTDTVHLTRVHCHAVGDAVMPAGWLSGFTLLDSEPGEGCTFLTYGRA
jgi:dihydrofolate reductase